MRKHGGGEAYFQLVWLVHSFLALNYMEILAQVFGCRFYYFSPFFEISEVNNCKFIYVDWNMFCF